MNLFEVVTNRPVKERNGLEAHLIEVSEAWASGRGDMKPKSLKAFLMLLKNEHHWYCRENRGEMPVDVYLNGHEREIWIQPSGQLVPSAKIKIN